MSGHAPKEERTNAVRVKCATSGSGYDIAGEECECYTLADVEAWCAELRRLGATDGLVLDEADGLAVTMDLGSP